MFNKIYAKYYDKIYANKDYEGECEFLDQIFNGYYKVVYDIPNVAGHGESIQTVLDLGCGTGRHAEILSDMGYEVYGVDKSEYMVEAAKERGVKAYTSIGDLPLKDFDACISMFNTIGYIGANRLEFIELLTWLYYHVGLLVFDFWNGIAIDENGLYRSERYIGDGIIRKVIPAVSGGNIAKMKITLEDDKSILCYEVHRVRYFYVDELVSLLGQPITFYKAYDFERPSEDDFIIVCVKNYRLHDKWWSK